MESTVLGGPGVAFRGRRTENLVIGREPVLRLAWRRFAIPP
jgi:hypothetical protein